MKSVSETNYCECCNRLLNNKRIVQLERNWLTNLYCVPGTVPESQSQGIFTFGKGCAAKLLKISSEVAA
jgi:hypothetical protein